jgi:hypothetical protein
MPQDRFVTRGPRAHQAAVCVHVAIVLLGLRTLLMVSRPPHRMPGTNPDEGPAPAKICPECGAIVSHGGSRKIVCPSCGETFRANDAVDYRPR